jgi:hypothetical protein
MWLVWLVWLISQLAHGLSLDLGSKKDHITTLISTNEILGFPFSPALVDSCESNSSLDLFTCFQLSHILIGI